MKLQLQKNGTGTYLVISSPYKAIRRKVSVSGAETEKIANAKNPRVVPRLSTLLNLLSRQESVIAATRKSPTSLRSREYIESRIATTMRLKERLLPGSNQITQRTYDLPLTHNGHTYQVQVVVDLTQQVFKQGMLTVWLLLPRMPSDEGHRTRMSHKEFEVLLDAPDESVFGQEPYRSKLKTAAKHAIHIAEARILEECLKTNQPLVRIYEDEAVDPRQDQA